MTRYTEEVRADERAATELGINGVPFFVLDRRYGVSGAQSPDILLQALEQAWADSHPSLVLTPVGAGAGDAACTERHLRDVTACVRCRATAHVEKADDVRMATDPHRFLSTGEQRWAETLEHQLANLFPALLRSGRLPAQAAGMGGLRLEFCQLVGKSTDAAAELAKADAELRTALTDLERVLALGVGPVRLGEDGELIIPPLTAEDIPAEAEVLKAELTELLPFAPIVSLLIELDRRTGFLDCFTHAGGKQARTPELAPLGREFSQEQEVQRLADVVRWRGQRLVAPAEDALRDVLRRPYRDDPEATVARLAGVAMDGLPDDLARRVFGLWSNACARLVDQRGWHEPYCYAPATSRGVVFARPMHHGPYEVVSALGAPDWQPGQRVAGSLPRGARELAIR